MYSTMAVRELHAELRRRKASVAGIKADLINRLEAYDQNLSFGEESDTQEDNTFKCPPSDSYEDVNADSPIPNISKEDIQEYFERFNTLPSGQLLYESRHLVTARFACDGTYTYLRGQCKARTKNVTYVADVKVSREGTIEECHCECAAGSGTEANCKHVSVLLLGAHDLVNNKCILLHQACTQQLMFKKPKKIVHKSPMAAQTLPSKRLKSCNYEPLPESEIMHNYEDYVRNLAIGYGETSMPLLQCFEPANAHGIEWDHSYTNECDHDPLLNDSFLKDITINRILKVELEEEPQDNMALLNGINCHHDESLPACFML